MANDGWDTPMAMVDIVILTWKDDALHVALLQRDKAPEKGRAALVGGFVHMTEDLDLDDAVSRILKEKAGLTDVFVEQLYSFGGANRDARGWSITVTYLALMPLERIQSLDRDDIVLMPIPSRSSLPFDHDRIVDKALERLRDKGIYSTLPAKLLPSTFTLADLQRVYEVTTGKRFDMANFRRKMTDLAIAETGEMSRDTRRPAALYRLREGALLFDRAI